MATLIPRHVLCAVRGHKPKRWKVWKDGYHYRCRCERCDTPLIRDAEGWRPFDLAIDGHVDRLPHPHFHMPPR